MARDVCILAIVVTLAVREISTARSPTAYLLIGGRPSFENASTLKYDLSVRLFGTACLGDPCDDYSLLPNDGLRYEHALIDYQDPVFQDTYLKEGWYKSQDTMLDHEPESINQCGTKFPIWNNDHTPLPTTENVIETKSVCQKTVFNPCANPHTIQVVKCVDGYRYYLTRTELDSAYCFGVGQAGVRTDYMTPQPEVKVHLDHDTETYGILVTSTRFSCDFTASQDPLWYMVHWYQNGVVHYNTPFGESSTDSRLFITEEVFVEKNFNMGMNLSCSVTAFFVENGPPGRRSSISENQFVGIKILTPNIVFNKDEAGVILLQPTVPIGCQGTNACKLRLTTHIEQPEVAGECQHIAVEAGCGTDIIATNWNDNISLTVVPNEVQQIEQASYEINLITDTSENRIWQKYTLDPVYVTTTTGTIPAVDSVCKIVNDPHYYTWDNRIFDDHSEGVKTVYWNPEFDTEVQIRTKSCRGEDHTYGWIQCICGVAVRAGLDVYVWDVCDELVFLGYKYCAESGRSLTVRANSDTDIKVYFSYGTYVHVVSQYIFSSTFLKAYIYPTSWDRQTVRGLCGTFDGDTENDFHRRDGTAMSADYHNQFPSQYWSRPEEFSTEWRVPTEDDLFGTVFDTGNLSPSAKTYCVCEPGDNVGGTPTLQDSIPCTATGAATCIQGTLLEANHCDFIPTRKRRAVDVHERSRAPRVRIGNRITSSSIKKREADTGVWTAESARQYCNDQFDASPLYQSCSQIESLKLDDCLDVCDIDIQRTNATDWLSSSINNMGAECKEALIRNVTLVREAAKGDNPLFTDIDASYCTDTSCSGRGSCINGECVCDSGVGGVDCSVDLTAKPAMSGLVDGGVCDASTSSCNETFVFGGQYVDGTGLKCKVKAFEEDESGTRIYTSEVTVTPTRETYIELNVQLPDGSQSRRRRRRRSTMTSDDTFVTGYSISVTNDGQTYSDSSDLFVYDSTCQQMLEVNGTIRFTLNDGYCFIENQCVMDGDINPADNCTFCDQTTATRQWTINATKPGCATPNDDTDDEEEGSSTDTAIIVGAAVAGGVLFMAVVVSLLVWLIKKAFRPKTTIGNSTLFDSQTVIRSEPGLKNGNTIFKSDDYQVQRVYP